MATLGRDDIDQFRRQDPLADLKKGMLMSSVGIGNQKKASRKVNFQSSEIIGSEGRQLHRRAGGSEARAANLLNMSPLSSIQASY